VATTFQRVGDAGTTITHRFCPKCGATVAYELADMPGVIAIPVGAFADPGFAAPTYSVYEARKHGWVVVPSDIEHVD
jgi:hypothetical protein